MSAVKVLSGFLITLLKRLFTVAAAVGAIAALALGCFSMAFPEERSVDFEHLVIPDSITDCYSCHAKMTPKLTHDWYESPHRVKLVGCSDCHGHPDGTGTIPFAAHPDQRIVCGGCHEPAVRHAEANFGIDLDCSGCHPFHQNSLHHDASERSESERKVE